jgi:hypothetical protein
MTIRVNGWIIVLYNAVLLGAALISERVTPQSLRTSGGVQISIFVPLHDERISPTGRPPSASLTIRP